MKKFTTIIFLSSIILQINAQDVYDDAITAASYAYSHSKKAHGANNVFHTQEYADKAVEAFEKVETYAAQCGCNTANDMAYEARTNMESSLDQDTYERSRFYAKQAKELAPEILKELSNCRAIASADIDIEAERNNDIAEASAEVAKQKIALENKSRELKIEQAKLTMQIAEQKKMQKEFEALRAAELQQQAAIKTKAELALSKLEIALQEFSVVFNDDSDFESLKDYTRSDNALKNETLDDTKSFYVNRARELAKNAMKQFASFEDN